MFKKFKRRVSSGIAAMLAIVLWTGCRTPLPPGAEPGPDHTMAYYVPVEATSPGARIEVNGADMGNTPVRIKIYGDPDGTFHDFGSYYYVVRARPINTNQYEHVRYFLTGRGLSRQDRIPTRIYFDMNVPQPIPPPVIYDAPVGAPSYYWDPFWGPSPNWPHRFFYGPGFHGHSHFHHRHHWR